MRLLFRSSFDQWTGYGRDAVDIAVTLDRLGVDVVPYVDTAQAGLPKEFTRLLEKEPYGSYDAALQFAPPYDVRPWRLPGDKKFGWTMWERTPMQDEDFPDDWPEGRRWKGIEQMFVTCPMNVKALQAQDDALKLTVAPLGVRPFPELVRSQDRPMRFLMVGMLGGRKDPFLLLDAWRELKREVADFDAELILKTAAPGLHPGIETVYPDVTVISTIWPEEKLLALYQQCDVLVSVSRGEGMNKPAMEFMATGGVVMASEWGGHRNWLHKDWAFPLAGEVVKHPQGWSDFRVDRQGLKEALLECWRSDRLHEMGRIARGVMLTDFAWEKRVNVVVEQMSRS